MMIPAFVRKLSYVQAVRVLVRSTGLQPIASKLYHQLSVSDDQILNLSYAGCQAKFLCPTPAETRALQLFSSGPPEEFRELVNYVKPEETFFDVGAQYGVYALLAANALTPKTRVVAFEPFPTEFALLQKNVELNKNVNVQIENIALSDHDGEAAMSNSNEKGEHCPRISDQTAGSFKVRTRRGDSLISAGVVPFPNVIKLDVEGHELAVLRGLAQTLEDPRCHGVYCEIHDSLLPSGEASADILNFLRNKGFDSISERPGENHRVFAEKLPRSSN